MEKLVSSWFHHGTLPQSYVFPSDKRPGEVIVPLGKNIPVIDLGKELSCDRDNTVQRIMNASKEFGLFQVINHGVSESLMYSTIRVFDEFFNLPKEDKASFYSDDPRKSCRLHTSNNYNAERVHLWRDSLKHPCHPLGECMASWPEKPARYRDVVGTYSAEIKSLSQKILDLICEGLGLEPGYFGNEFTKAQLLSGNYYPPCPDPSLTLGAGKHSDPNLITLTLQGDISGLQVFKDGLWIGVEPLPNAFVVVIGLPLQIISNGKLRSGEHRAVTNSRSARTSVGTFFIPCYSSTIEPAKALVNEFNHPLYRPFQFQEFLKNFAAMDGDTEALLKHYKLSPSNGV